MIHQTILKTCCFVFPDRGARYLIWSGGAIPFLIYAPVVSSGASAMACLPALCSQVAMLLFDVHTIQGPICYIGLQHFSSIPLLVYDALYSAFLTWQFVLPLLKKKDGDTTEEDSQLKVHALRKNLAAATVSVTVSFANILSLVLLHHGVETHVCWSACMVDVLVNSLVVCSCMFAFVVLFCCMGSAMAADGAGAWPSHLRNNLSQRLPPVCWGAPSTTAPAG